MLRVLGRGHDTPVSDVTGTLLQKTLTVSHNLKMTSSSNNNPLQGYICEPKYDESTEETPATYDVSHSLGTESGAD